MENKKIKAISLLSGGLDSSLAVKILQDMNIEVIGLCFNTPFFNPENINKISKELGIKIITKNITKEHLKMLKNPKHGYGKNMNPCIDCHGLMLKIAKRIMKSEKASFVATGEVLGQRPMSQNSQSLKTVEKIAGLENMIVRPLSGKLLLKTIPEEEKLINRKDLLDISGRSRKVQLNLAREFKIKSYLSPAGGCLLTDQEFSKKLKELFNKRPDSNENDIELLKYGRHFWEENIKIIIGRNEKDNKNIIKLSKSSDYLMELKDFTGPTGLIRGKINQKIFQQTGRLIIKYSNKVINKNKVVLNYAKKNKFIKSFCKKLLLNV